MAIEPLNLKYFLLGKEIGLYSKTGIYHPSHEQHGDGAIIPENDPDGWLKSSY